MALFHGDYYTPDSSFTPLFRLLDDFDSYTRGGKLGSEAASRNSAVDLPRGSRALRTFTPKFDVLETKEAYEIYGEVPGVPQENIEIDFLDGAIVIRGRVERNYTTNNQAKSPNAITQNSDVRQPHKVTVEDEPVEETHGAAQGATKVKSPGSEITKRPEGQDKPKSPAASEKFLVAERMVGEFSRTFTFPNRVDPDAVVAELDNGILSITVPKAKNTAVRRITVKSPPAAQP